jgi:hypothetical protein
MSRLFHIAAFLGAFVQTASCGLSLANGTSFEFASVEKGRQALATRDDFVERLSGFDRAGRLKTDRPVSEAEYLRFVETNVLAWTDSEKAVVSAAIEQLEPALNKLALPLPKTVLFVRTTGREEGGQQYTRANAVVLNASILGSGPGRPLKQCIAHELFHVLSRANAALRERCYASIGFKPCDEVSLPATLGLPRLTDPDAPKNNHYIELTAGGKTVDAVPVLYARPEKYDAQKGGEFFSYLEFKFLTVPKDTGQTPTFGSDSQLLDPGQVSGFFEQIGKNTQYIIHPEEILADNFALMVLGETPASPEILVHLKDALRKMD